MIPFRAFEKLIGFITGNRAQLTQDHMEFLEFYQDLVRIIPDDLATAFGSIVVPTMVNGEVHKGYRLQLNVTDYGWWRSVILDGGRFVESTFSVQRNIWDHLNSQTSEGSLTNEQKLELLNLLDDPELVG